MQKLIIVLSFFLSTSITLSQNLVPNPSFEDYDTCIRAINSFNPSLPTYNGLKNWISPNDGSPDLMADCITDTNFGMPQNAAGFQQARTGKSMVSLGNSLQLIQNYREYVQTELLQELIANKKYCFSIFVSLIDSTWIATDNFGVHISDTAIYSFNVGLFDFTPQITNPIGNVLDDKINWVEISGEYIAQGGEKYITIGIFEDDNQINTFPQPYGSLYWESINLKVFGYYLDDVSLRLCDTVVDTIPITNAINSLNLPNAFTPNTDGINDIFRVQGQNIKTLNGKILNRWGQELFTWTDVNSGWDGMYKGKEAAEGTYFYVVTVAFEDGEVRVERGSLMLTR